MKVAYGTPYKAKVQVPVAIGEVVHEFPMAALMQTVMALEF